MRARNPERNERMAALYRDGALLREIAQQYGISREGVRQILKRHFYITGLDGGRFLCVRQRRQARAVAKEKKFLAMYGCTVAQWKGAPTKARRAWVTQVKNSRARSIPWQMTFWEWWTFWQQSGKWEQRGRGRGYVMCRTGDVGPYALGNVFIATAVENISSSKWKKSNLPMGVFKRPSGRYGARRTDGKKVVTLGTFDTPESAHAAYRASTPWLTIPTQSQLSFMKRRA